MEERWTCEDCGWVNESGRFCFECGRDGYPDPTPVQHLAPQPHDDEPSWRRPALVAGAIALLVVLMIAYYCGGYVAGRMSRFDGARQGFGAWMFGIAVTILLALAAVILGSEYNVLDQLNLPSLPVGESTLTTGGAIALAAIVLGTLLAAIVGGKAGERYHRKVDRVAFID